MTSRKKKLKPWLIKIYNNGGSIEYIIKASSRNEVREQARLIMKSFPFARGFDVKQLRRAVP